jgi:hypothetical protein
MRVEPGFAAGQDEALPEFELADALTVTNLSPDRLASATRRLPA